MKTTLLKRTGVPSYKFLSTGSILLNLAISCNLSHSGGLLTNSIIEFSGTGASGKTYILSEICGDALRKDYDFVIVDDIERRWDLVRLSTFGIDLKDKRFVYLEKQSQTVEECFDRMFVTLDKLKKNSKLLYIVDPVAALYSKVELTGSDKMGQARAKALHKRMRFLKDRIGGSKDITIVFSNQLIDNVGGPIFGPKKRTPMGNALVHWPSLKVRFTSPGKLTDTISVNDGKSKKIVRGILLNGVVTKNTNDDAYREALFSIRYGYGIDNIYDCSVWLKMHTKMLDGKKNIKYYKLPKKNKEVARLPTFISYIEKNSLENTLFHLTKRSYKKLYEYSIRKRKVYSTKTNPQTKTK